MLWGGPRTVGAFDRSMPVMWSGLHQQGEHVSAYSCSRDSP